MKELLPEHLNGSYLVITADSRFSELADVLGHMVAQASDLQIVEPHKDSIGIEIIHGLQKQLSLTSSRSRIIVIRRADSLTIVAQNALLKTLEEPPTNTAILLCAVDSMSLLPTIRSRCQLIKLPTASTSMPLTEEAEHYFGSSLYERLLQNQAVLKQDQTKEFLDTLTRVARQKLRQEPGRYANLIEELLQCYELYNANGNKKFILDKLAMEVDS